MSVAHLQIYPDNIPDLLKVGVRHVTWRSVGRNGTATKVPYIPGTDKKAESDEPETWRTFEEAAAAWKRGGYAGIGRMFHADDGLVGIDIDKCRDPVTEEIAAWALPIIRAVNSYTEVSPSGTGVKIWARGPLPPVGRVKAYGTGQVEMYCFGRYFTQTGWPLEDTPRTVEDRPDAIAAVHRMVFGDGAKSTPKNTETADTHLADVPDDEILEALFSEKNGEKWKRLWDGDCSDYANEAGQVNRNSVDLALCNKLAFYTGRDADRMDQLFRESGLMRPKWDRAARAGETYGEGTIRVAIENCDETWDGPGNLIEVGGGIGMPRRPIGRRATDPVGGSGRVNGSAPGTNHTAEAGPAEDTVTDTDDAADEDEPPTPTSKGNRPCTQLGNSERLVDEFGDRLLYCKTWGEWLCWDGRRWKLDDTVYVTKLAKEVVRSIHLEAHEATTRARRRALSSWAVASEAERHINAMVSLARSALPATPDQFDTNIWLLNCRNGTVDLRTGELREHRQSDYITKLIDIDYDPEAECPLWESVLERVLPDQSVRDFVQRASGYSATGSARERKIIIPHGPGRNGKGVTLETQFQVLGEYGSRTPAETFMARRNDSIPNNIAALRGVRFVYSSETDDGHRLAEAVVKDLTGGESISARFMRGEWFSFPPTFTPWLSTNHRPVIRGSDPAIWDRIALVPFTVRIPDEEQDPDLLEKLKPEYPGILAWIIRGAANWYRNGLGIPSAVRAATSSYQGEMDLIGSFIGECCVLDSDERTGWVLASSLYDAYTKWCGEAGEKNPLPKRTLGLRLAERGYTAKERVGGIHARGWLGLRLRTDSDGMDL